MSFKLKDHHKEMLDDLKHMSKEEIQKLFKQAMEDTKDSICESHYCLKCDSCIEGDNFSPFWHPYPKEIPTVTDKIYLVTYKSRGTKHGNTYLAYYYSGDFEMVDADCWLEKPDIIAWAELPKAYRSKG